MAETLYATQQVRVLTVKAGHQPESSVAWSGGDPGCEAYTESVQAA